jgi:glycosyltransferase involved in cell wall biosynthesis
VANGAAPPACSWNPSRGSRTILFLGPFRYEPNLAGIVCFLETVYPRLLEAIPGIRMEVLAGNEGVSISRRFGCFLQQGVEVRGHTNEVQAHLSGCALTVNPLSVMRGSSIKLAESLASGRICVSTEAGARGFRSLKAKSLVVVPEIQDMFEPIRELLTNEAYRIEREAPGEALLSELSWGKQAREQARLYDEMLSGTFWGTAAT